MEEPIGQLPNPTESNSLDKYLVSRKRKNEENIENGDQNGVQGKTKKLKWETYNNKRCEATIEHAVYFNKEETSEYFEKLEKQITYLSPEQTSTKVYGQHYNLPREVAVYGDSNVQYKQPNRLTIEAREWCPILLKIKEQIQDLKKVKYNICTVDRYANGESTMGIQAYDEDDVDQSVPICSVSFGATRDMKFKPSRNNEDPITITLHDGHVLFMTEPTQKNWKHAVPKRRKCKTTRISCTFRKLIMDEEETVEGDSDQNKVPADSTTNTTTTEVETDHDK